MKSYTIVVLKICALLRSVPKKMSDQIHAPVAFIPEKEFPVLIG